MKGLSILDNEFAVIKTDADLFSESIRRIIMTNPGERVGRPYFGVGLRNVLFDQIDQEVLQSLERVIREQIETYEPRVDLTTVNIIGQSESNTVVIKIGFKIKGEPFSDERFIEEVFKLEG